MGRNVFSLVCARDLKLSETCLKTLAANCRDSIELILVNDGSLADQQFRDLSVSIGAKRALRAKDLVEECDARLGNYPFAKRFLREDIFSLKLIAFPLLDGGAFAYCDSDIFFGRPFIGCFERLPSRVGAFLPDAHSAYSCGVARLVGLNGVSMVERNNAGLINIAEGVWDIDFIEWFLSKPEHRARPFLVEQTCWAALAARGTPRQWRREDFFCSEGPLPAANSDLAGIHFVGRAHKLIAEQWIASVAREASASPRRLTLMPAPVLTRASMFRHYFRRMIRAWSGG